MGLQRTALEEANRRFYRAFESLKLKRMEAAWRRDGQVSCVHPGWPLLTGWGDVMRSWRLIFEATRYIEFGLTNVSIHAPDDEEGGLGWVLCQENILSHVGGQTLQSAVLSTNVFEWHEERWQLLHHHGSQIVRDALPPE